jgi:lipopolysaccharide export system protein LptC
MSDGLRWLRPDASTPRKIGSLWHVRLARVIVPVVAAGLLVLTVLWAQLNPEAEVKKVDLTEVQNTVETARFTSVDDKGRPFVIEADRVVQQDPSTMTATLAAPRGELTLDNQDKLSVQARDGVYDHPNQKLKLKGEVQLQQNADMTFTTEALDVDLKDRSAQGDAPVQGSSKDGSALQAQGVIMSPNAGVLTFKGPATLTLAPKKEEKTVQ